MPGGVRRVLNTVLQVVLLLLLASAPVGRAVAAPEDAPAAPVPAATRSAHAQGAGGVSSAQPAGATPRTRPAPPDTGVGTAAGLLTTTALATLFGVLLLVGRRRDVITYPAAE